MLPPISTVHYNVFLSLETHTRTQSTFKWFTFPWHTTNTTAAIHIHSESKYASVSMDIALSVFVISHSVPLLTFFHLTSTPHVSDQYWVVNVYRPYLASINIKFPFSIEAFMFISIDLTPRSARARIRQKAFPIGPFMCAWVPLTECSPLRTVRQQKKKRNGTLSLQCTVALMLW